MTRCLNTAQSRAWLAQSPAPRPLHFSQPMSVDRAVAANNFCNYQKEQAFEYHTKSGVSCTGTGSKHIVVSTASDSVKSGVAGTGSTQIAISTAADSVEVHDFSRMCASNSHRYKNFLLQVLHLSPATFWCVRKWAVKPCLLAHHLWQMWHS